MTLKPLPPSRAMTTSTLLTKVASVEPAPIRLLSQSPSCWLMYTSGTKLMSYSPSLAPSASGATEYHGYEGKAMDVPSEKLLVMIAARAPCRVASAPWKLSHVDSMALSTRTILPRTSTPS